MFSKNKSIRQNFYFYISIIEGIIAFIITLSISSDPKNAVLFGLSYARLMILLGIVLVCILFVLPLVKIKKALVIVDSVKQFMEKKVLAHEFIRISVYLMLYGFIFIPSYQFGRYIAIYERIQPFLVYISLVILQALIFIQFREIKNSFSIKRVDLKKLLPEIIVITVVVLTVIFSGLTRIGITVDHFFWGGAATPLLISTLIFSLWGTAFVFFIKIRVSFFRKWFDIIVPLLLFFFAIVIWNSVPFYPSFFAPAPVPPNNMFYPYSDAHYYDTTAQSLMVGEGFLNRGWVQKPFYGYLLFLFHLVAGEDYLSTVFLQTCLYAIVPILFYLIGKKLYSRYLGVFFALVGIIREVTAMNSTPWIEVTHSRIMMAEPVAVLISTLLCYLVINWYMAQTKNVLQLVKIGFLLMIGIMTRGNMLFYYIPIIFILMINKSIPFRKRVVHVGILVFSSVLIALPWMIRNQIYTGYFSIESNKFQSVINARYGIRDANEQLSTQEPIFENSIENAENTEINPTPEILMIEPSADNEKFRQPTAIPKSVPTTVVEEIHSPEPQIIKKSIFDSLLEVSKFTAAHFIHNEILSVFILPNTLTLETVKNVIDHNEFFSELWNGQMSFQLIISTFINVIILAIGIGTLFRKLSWISLFPLSLHLFYNLTNGLARVSGWRYVFVTDWVIILYFLIGILSIFLFITKRFALNPDRFDFSPVNQACTSKYKFTKNWSAVIFLFSLLVGMLIPEIFIKSKYRGEISKEEISSLLINNEIFADHEIQKLSTILEDNETIIVHAKAFYPRFYIAETGEPGSGTPWFNYNKFDRIGFTIVGPVRTGVILPLKISPEKFPNAEEVYVIGKWDFSVPDHPYLDGQFVFLPDEEVFYFSSQD